MVVVAVMAAVSLHHQIGAPQDAGCVSAIRLPHASCSGSSPFLLSLPLLIFLFLLLLSPILLLGALPLCPG